MKKILSLAATLSFVLSISTPTEAISYNGQGWLAYSHHDYQGAIHAFALDRAADPYGAAWGLANVYENSHLRAFAAARSNLLLLLKSPLYRARALHSLAQLPPDSADPSFQPNALLTYSDAVALALSFRSLPANETPQGSNAFYLAMAKARGLYSGTANPNAAAPRLFLAQFLSKLYGIDVYSYLRPFSLSDIQTLPAQQQMLIQSMLGTGLMTANGGQFHPFGFETRAAFAVSIAKANALFAHPSPDLHYVTLPLPSVTTPYLYMFSAGPETNAQKSADVALHSQVNAYGIVGYPFISLFPKGAAVTRQVIDQTHDLLTPFSAGSGLANLAQTIGSRGFMVIGNYNSVTNQSDTAFATQLLSDKHRELAVASEAVQIATREHLSGITLDFENIASTDTSAYSQFVALFAQKAHAVHLKLMVCVPEKASALQDGYDWQAIAKSADMVMLITYDEHNPNTKPGAVEDATYDDWVIKYALTQMPANKILLGMADYGYDWSANGATEISMPQGNALAHTYGYHIDARSQNRVISYSSQGVQHTVWYPSDATVTTIASYVRDYGLKGLAIWHVGAEDAGFYQAITRGATGAGTAAGFRG